MNDQVEFVVANIENASDIFNILKSNFPRDLLPYTIYSTSEYKYYLSNIINDDNNIFVLSKINNKVIGFAHFRLFDKTIFLNNIFLDKKSRGLKIGSNLYNFGLTNIRDIEHYKQIELDVFSSNNIALNWYYNLGFRFVRKNNWVLNPVIFKSIVSKHKFIIDNIYKKGFHNIVLKDNNNVFKIGIIAGKILRITDSNCLNSELFYSLVDDYKMSILYIGEENLNGKCLTTSYRLRKDL